MENKENKNIDNTYPISKNNRQCIGPCYNPNKFIIHPINLTFVTGPKDKPFCPTNNYEVNENGKKYKSSVDVCFKETDYINNNQIQMDILNPMINFDHELFLASYYNILTYENLIDWLDKNKNSPINTKLRIIECSWKAFKDKIYFIDLFIIEIYMEYFIENINIFYNKLHKYIDIEKDKLSFKKTNIDIKTNIIERINFLKDKLLNTDEISKFLNKYFEKYRDNINEISFEKKEILQNYINYLENKIEKSL